MLEVDMNLLCPVIPIKTGVQRVLSAFNFFVGHYWSSLIRVQFSHTV